MADDVTTSELDAFISESDQSSMGRKLEGPEQETYTPQYRMFGNDRIPISKSYGKIWNTRRQAALGRWKSDGTLDRWDEAIRYYRHDQGDRKVYADDTSSDTKRSVRPTTMGVETENIVFANVSALVPATYAKNPQIEVSAVDAKYRNWCAAAERLVNAIMSKRTAPGVDLKPKAKRAVVMATLTNYAWIEVGYTEKEQSSEETLAELDRIGKEMAVERDISKLKDLEAQMQALEDRVDALSPSGPFVRFYRPQDVLVDPDACEFCEARWIMTREYMSTKYIQSVYGERDEKGQYKSVYRPTHVLKLDNSDNAQGMDDDSNMFVLQDADKQKYNDFGYLDEVSYNNALRTCVWRVWDKTTRRVYLYADNDWTWPLWVWDDPYGFGDFFPLSPLSFYTDPAEMFARSEVTYYLDQQDSINAINNEMAKVRSYLTGKVFYNKNVVTDEKLIESFLSGTTNKRAQGVDLDAQADVNKLFFSVVPASASALQTVIFDKERIIQAVDRISSVTNVMRGVEYKTNTTNRAIESYESNTQSRLDEKIDCIEDWLGDIGDKLLFLCMTKMDNDTIQDIIGEERMQDWLDNTPTPEQYQNRIAVRVMGGSTLKPTSASKKQQAIQISQALGQFSRGAPLAFVVALKVMQEAFDDFVISKEDWTMIINSATQSAQQQQAGGGEGAQQGGGQAQSGSAGQEQQVDNLLDQADALLQQMPMKLKEGVAKAILQGMPIKEAIGRATQVMQTMAQQNPQGGVQ